MRRATPERHHGPARCSPGLPGHRGSLTAWVAIVIRLLVLPLGLLMALAAAGDEARIRVDAAHHGFIDGSGHPFVPVGVSYYRPGTGWAPQLWKRFDAEATRQDFARLRSMGMTTVRVFITFGSFYTQPGHLDAAGLAVFDRLLDLADEAGLHVHPTGPEGWEGMPEWTQAIGDVFTDLGNEACLAAVEDFWRLFAARYRGRATIWAYDLRNEPVVAWETTSAQRGWSAWRASRGRQPVAVPSALAAPGAPAQAGDDDLLDYQHFREQVAETWVERQARAIRLADPSALVTLGLLQWSIPAQGMPARQYSGFRPALIARHLDFLELHYYPLATGVYRYQGEEAEAANLAVLEAMARECAKPGLPLVIAEFGWYGGGPLDEHGPPASEEHQARWCGQVVQVTRSLACGWLNWGMYDDPQATDVSRLTGLITVDGADKAWGRAFTALARQRAAGAAPFALPDRPDLPWDACCVRAEAGEAFRKAYLAAFLQHR